MTDEMFSFPGMNCEKFIENMSSKSLPINCIIFPNGKVCAPRVSPITALKHFAYKIYPDRDYTKMDEQGLVNETQAISFHKDGTVVRPDPFELTPMQEDSICNLVDSRIIPFKL